MSISLQSLDTIAITTAVAGSVVDIGSIPPGTRHITVHANFVYGSGGTSAKFYLQTSVDGGNTWYDVAALAHTTASLRRIISIDAVAGGSVSTALDGALTDNTKIDGLVGDRLRIKYTTVGTYADDTTCKIDLAFR